MKGWREFSDLGNRQVRFLFSSKDFSWRVLGLEELEVCEMCKAKRQDLMARRSEEGVICRFVSHFP